MYVTMRFRLVLFGALLTISALAVFKIQRSIRKASDSQTSRTDDIYFIESSGRSCLNGRQACAVESASFHNPNNVVKLMVTAPPNASCDFYGVIRALRNVEVHVLDVETVFFSTPLETWFLTSQWRTSPYHVVHLSDALRYLLLWQKGGIYVDLDFVVLQSLNGVRNSAVYELVNYPANSILFFDRGHPFLAEIMRECLTSYRLDEWACCGPVLFAKVYPRLCRDSDCLGVKMLPVETAFPYYFPEWEQYFEPRFAARVLKKTEASRAVHLWNRESQERTVKVGEGSAYDVLAKRNCPRVYSLMSSAGYF